MHIRTHAAIAAIALGVAAQAQIITTGVIAVDVDPSYSNVQEGVHESNSFIWAMDEAQNVTLTKDLRVDALVGGSYFTSASLASNAKIAKGTTVDSFLIYSDTKNCRSNHNDYAGTVTFGAPILGIIITSGHLNDSDTAVGGPGMTYPHGDGARGLELHNGNPYNEGVIWNQGTNTITFDARTFDNVDEVRVITAQAVPEPGAFLALATPLVGIALKRRSRRNEKV